ncbi:hypothetical protein B0H16DRAFT_1460338 [Mycena metata]|uniref:Zn(2)-C6 fungal-type domain-containing protein n=1 Tax=Mycena metata TaxID=1033252 RepID=A0AAD7IWW7_9AGAR|nr:hypothetical protein B0H16DRAFT_1460338 [Mycena metata]
MSNPFGLEKKVLIACSNCRTRRQKCMSESEDKPCMRCRRKGLSCEYLPMRKQKPSKRKPTRGGLGNQSAVGGQSHSTAFPPSLSSLNYAQQMPGNIQEPSGHANNPNSLSIQRTSHYVVPWDVPSSWDGQIDGGSYSTITSGSQYPPTSDGNRAWPIVPDYMVEAPGSNSDPRYPILGMHPGTTPIPMPQDASPGYPPSYSNQNFGYETNHLQ